MVQVTEDDFLKARNELIPSVSEKELEHYKMVQMRFNNQEENRDRTEVGASDGNGELAGPSGRKGKGKAKAG